MKFFFNYVTSNMATMMLSLCHSLVRSLRYSAIVMIHPVPGGGGATSTEEKTQGGGQ